VLDPVGFLEALAECEIARALQMPSKDSSELGQQRPASLQRQRPASLQVHFPAATPDAGLSAAASEAEALAWFNTHHRPRKRAPRRRTLRHTRHPPPTHTHDVGARDAPDDGR